MCPAVSSCPAAVASTRHYSASDEGGRGSGNVDLAQLGLEGGLGGGDGRLWMVEEASCSRCGALGIGWGRSAMAKLEVAGDRGMPSSGMQEQGVSRVGMPRGVHVGEEEVFYNNPKSCRPWIQNYF